MRHVTHFDEAEARHVILENFSDPNMSFFYPESRIETSADFSFDAASNGKELFFTVCSYARNNKGPEAVEIFLNLHLTPALDNFSSDYGVLAY